MLELPHTLVGAAIATAIPNPLISLPLALASHFITDYVPHWNPHLHTEIVKNGRLSTLSKTIVFADAGLALILGSYIAFRVLPNTNHFLTILIACFLAVSPDVAEIPYYFFKWRPAFVTKLVDFQRSHQWNVPPVWGILSQIVIISLSLWTIFA